MKYRIPLLFFFFLFTLSVSAKNEVAELRVEYIDKPLGIEVNKPRFSWRMQSKERGTAQTAYQIEIRNEQDEIVWNSGKREIGRAHV